MMCTSFLAKYKVLDKIGEGSFSEVLKCQDRLTGALYAAKRLKKIYQNVNEVLASPEVTAMRKITRHPNVLYMVESHYDLFPGRVTLIFELMDMSLYDLMKNRNGRLLIEVRVKHYVHQMLRGIEHLHKNGIFHRDVKPENILVKGSVAKIGDLGSIRGVYSRPPYTAYISTRWYRSPECLLTGGYYGPKMDVWALGCVFFELLTLEPLFPGENEVDQISRIHSVLGTPHARLVAKFRRISRTRNVELHFPARDGQGLGGLLPQLSKLGLNALQAMLTYDPENRASPAKLLEHRYFSDLKERETTRQTRSSLLPASLSQTGKWQHPIAQPYFSSDRYRRLRMNDCEARVVESTPNANWRSANTRQQLPTEQNRLDELRHTHVGRYFLRKRPGPHYNRSNAQPKKWSDPSIKLVDMRYSENNGVKRETYTVSESNTRPFDKFSQSFYLNKDIHVKMNQRDNQAPINSSRLPSIYRRPNKNSVHLTESSSHILGDNSNHLSLATSQKPSYQALPRKVSVKSPLRKMARCEMGNDYYIRSESFDSSKVVPRKSCERRISFHDN